MDVTLSNVVIMITHLSSKTLRIDKLLKNISKKKKNKSFDKDKLLQRKMSK